MSEISTLMFIATLHGYLLIAMILMLMKCKLVMVTKGKRI